MFERKYNIHLNDRNKTATLHLAYCPHGHYRNDSRGKWLVSITESGVKHHLSGYKKKYCSKCGS